MVGEGYMLHVALAMEAGALVIGWLVGWLVERH